jgi:CheY-like chemotaxis protein
MHRRGTRKTHRQGRAPELNHRKKVPITKCVKFTFIHSLQSGILVDDAGFTLWSSSLEDPVILVIEDDPPIQMVIEDALIEGGYEPAIAASGEEAVTLLKSGLVPYRALVTDIRLRGTMDGWEVARQAREIDPEFPVVYITAAHADQWASQGVPNSVVITKPFATAQLVTAISNLLNAGSPPA